MKYIILILFLMMNSAYAAEPAIALEKVHINLYDKKSIERGAKFFATNCMICHTMIYLRYNKVAQNAGITYEKMPINIKSWPFGIKPPDLSLTANVRGVNWIYTYLHSFYMDPKRPTGFNNLVLPNTAMSGILVSYQGLQILAADINTSHRVLENTSDWYDKLILQSSGSMTPDEFDNTITDVVNFLAYAADPYYIQQVQMGYWTIAFLILFFVLAYFLKQTYWATIRNKRM
ncbi:MAG TPA: cytochrome c1 [Gammaproteobacteria bacterium]|nr:cytochrome c1 [Gammaproteobacteria bacterium]